MPKTSPRGGDEGATRLKIRGPERRSRCLGFDVGFRAQASGFPRKKANPKVILGGSSGFLHLNPQQPSSPRSSSRRRGVPGYSASCKASKRGIRALSACQAFERSLSRPNLCEQ